MTTPQAPSIRFRVEPGDVPAEKAARRLHLALNEFIRCLPELRRRGFPSADPTTGMYDLEAIDEWRRGRWQRPTTLQATRPLPQQTMGERFVAARAETAASKQRRKGK